MHYDGDNSEYCLVGGLKLSENIWWLDLVDFNVENFKNKSGECIHYYWDDQSDYAKCVLLLPEFNNQKEFG